MVCTLNHVTCYQRNRSKSVGLNLYLDLKLFLCPFLHAETHYMRDTLHAETQACRTLNDSSTNPPTLTLPTTALKEDYETIRKLNQQHSVHFAKAHTCLTFVTLSRNLVFQPSTITSGFNSQLSSLST